MAYGESVSGSGETATGHEGVPRSKVRKGQCTNKRLALLSVPGGTPSGDKCLSFLVAGKSYRCCRGCAVRKGWAVSELIRRGIDQAETGTYVGFLTVTEDSEPRPFDEHVAAAGRLLADVLRLLDRTEGVHRVRPFLAVRELQMQRLGKYDQVAWHSHVLILGWPKVDMSQLRDLVLRHGFGAQVKIKVQRKTSGAAGEGFARYLAKSFGAYFTKSARRGDDWLALQEHLPRGRQLVTKSRSWAGGTNFGDLEKERHLNRLLEQGVAPELARSIVDRSYREAQQVSEELWDACFRVLLRLGIVLEVDDPPDPPPESDSQLQLAV